jgi:hypothetical protein
MLFKNKLNWLVLSLVSHLGGEVKILNSFSFFKLIFGEEKEVIYKNSMINGLLSCSSQIFHNSSREKTLLLPHNLINLSLLAILSIIRVTIPILVITDI